MTTQAAEAISPTLRNSSDPPAEGAPHRPGVPDAAPNDRPRPQKVVRLRIRRQGGPDAEAAWQEFDVPYLPNLNIIACLQRIAAHPVTAEGQPTTAPVWDSGCLEEICGACTMLINGQARPACSALVDRISPDGEPITLQPLSKFPVVRDLYVDRSRLFEDLKRARAWVPIDGTYDLGPGPPVSPQLQQERYILSRCISCAACLEACPQYLPANSFVGAAVISQVRLFNEHPTGAALKEQRMAVMTGEGGVHNCSKAGNCVQVCPKDIPLLESIARVQREATWRMFRKLFGA